jgi:hypothetical protein
LAIASPQIFSVCSGESATSCGRPVHVAHDHDRRLAHLEDLALVHPAVEARELDRRLDRQLLERVALARPQREIAGRTPGT